MLIEDQVCSKDLSKRLKELGVKQDSLFFHTSGGVVSRIEALPILDTNYSAFTVAELGKMLPIEIPFTENGEDDISFLLTGKDQSGNWWVNYTNGVKDPNEANARAKMLIYLLENKLLELP